MIQQSTPGHISRKEGNSNLERFMHLNVHNSLFTIASTWKQHKCLSADECLKKMWYIDEIECYSDLTMLP